MTKLACQFLGEVKQALFDTGNDSAARALVETIRLLSALADQNTPANCP